MASIFNNSYRFMKYIWRHYLSFSPVKQFDKYKKKDSYVVVTGGSDGIGLEICH